MDAQSNSMNQFDNWCDMWQKAQEDEDFVSGCKDSDTQGSTSPEKIDFFGQNHEEADDEFEPGSLDYWTKIYNMSNNAGDAPDVTKWEVLTDGVNNVPEPVKPNLTDAEMGKVVKSMGNSANPIQPSSVGRDTDYKPNISNVYSLEQLSDMKINLHELECKLNVNDALGKVKDGVKVQAKIDELRKKIDELSDAITPNFLQSYLS
jgi:hypothetical protein